MIKKIHYFSLVLLATFSMSSSCDKDIVTNLSSDGKPTQDEIKFFQPFAATDELGRVLPGNEEVGDLKKNKQVGMFYFLWKGDSASKVSEHYWDLHKIIPEHPEVLEDIRNKYWGSTSIGSFYFWGEPIYGYYSDEDYWVHLRSMQLLTDAGVDFLVIDATNTIIYEKQSAALMKSIKALQDQGKTPPKIVYYTNTASGETMQKIYDAFYKKGAPCYFPSCWYLLDGKPLILGRTKEATGKDYQSFFTFREAQWPNEPEQLNGWPWIDFNRPQSVYKNFKGEREIINVSVAQHPNHIAGMGGSAFYGNNDNWGRSYRNGSHGNPDMDIKHGYNFQEQWDYALKQNVPFIFVTGWNEWVAGRWNSTDNNPEHSWFCDQASPEYSRDIEPTYTAELKDNYYMQLVGNIRRYKGVNPLPDVGNSKTITKLEDWNNMKPVYTDYLNDTEERNHPGAQRTPSKIYMNTTGRNDFYILKIARDDNNLYFYAQTKDNISSHKESNWMRLYINIDRNQNTGWYGYDYRIVNGEKLQKYKYGVWSNFNTIKVFQEGKKLMYTVPLNYLGVTTPALNFEFKWSDNMQNESDPLDWYINGDAAPGGRFNYIYKTKQ